MKMTRTLILNAIAVTMIVALAPVQAHAYGGGGAREQHKLGVSVGLIDQPFPSIWGANLNFNALSFARLTGGVGFINATGVSTGSPGTTVNTSLTTIAGEAKLMVPEWSFSPSAT